MKTTLLLGVLLYFGFVLTLAVFLKRRFHISYDRKVLLATFLFTLTTLFVWQFGDVSSDPFLETRMSGKIMWLAVIVLGTNAVTQLIFWLIYRLIIYNDFVKMPRFIFNIFSMILIVGVVLYMINQIFDVDLSALLVTSTVVSAVIGLSLQDTLTNLFAGLSLQIENPFNVDDWVNLGGFEGKVVSQNWRTLTIVTRENHRVFIPNKSVAEEKIVNYSKPSPRQIHSFDVDLDYSHPPNEVKRVLFELLNEIKEVEIDHIAFPWVKAYNASGVKYCIKYWINDYSDVYNIQDIVLTRLWYKLNRNQIKIPYQIVDVNLFKKTEEMFIKKSTDKVKYIQSKLSEQKWLSQLKEDQIKILAESAKLKSYARNDDLVTEGQPGDSMFIVTKGQTKVVIKGPNRSEVLVANKASGDFFGEMCLLTGDPRSATVRAADDCEVIVIDKQAFSEILLKDANILNLFVDSLESNQSQLTKIIEDERKNRNVPMKSARQIIMNKIMAYLDIGS
jgi:small-conductance mechanosensitive channel/CRP-like cAMP-binding protein